MKRSNRTLFFFVLPSFIVYTIFMLLPLIASLGLSLFEWSGYGDKVFVGFDNFISLFTKNPYNIRFLNALKNNIYFFVITMIIQNGTALILAVFLQRGMKGTKFFRTVFFAPSTVSVVIVGFLWTLIFNPIWGPLNVLLRSIGLDSIAIPWLGNEKTALAAIAIANAWQYTGIPMMLFIAGLNSIPEEQYEAVSVDGGGEWFKFIKVTIPNIMPIIIIVSMMTFVGNMSCFDIIYAMEGTLAGPNYSTDVLGTLFYRTAFGARTGAPPDMGMGATIAAIMTIFISAGAIFWLKMYMRKPDEL